MDRKLAALVLMAASTSVLQLPVARAATITGQTCQYCSPNDVSDGGSVIAGHVAETRYVWYDWGLFLMATGQTYPTLWTQEGVSTALRNRIALGSATAITPDGSTVVGEWSGGTNFSGGNYPSVPFRWTQATGAVSLGRPNDVRSAHAFGLSADGSIVMVGGGTCSAVGCYSGEGPLFRWTQAHGFEPLGVSGWGSDVSDDGSAVVGKRYVEIDETFTSVQAFRWTAATGAVDLGTFSSDFSSEAHAVSADGSVVVGSSADRAFRWTEATGMVNLGPGNAFDVSADGSMIVGTTFSYASPYSYSSQQAFIWTKSGGMRLLSDVLKHHGLDLNGWHLEEALTISADGGTIVGRGYLPAGGSGLWVVQLSIPEPSGLVLFTVALSALMFSDRRRAPKQAG